MKLGRLGSLLACLGCAHSPSLGGDWAQAQSQHFVVESNLPERELRELTLEFENSYAALTSCLYPGSDGPPGRSRVLIPGSWAQYDQIRPRNAIAHFAVMGWPFETVPTIVLPATERRTLMESFQHELVHRLVGHYFPAAPRWLNEGLAQVLSTAAIESDGVVIGRELSEHGWDGVDRTVFGHPLSPLAPEPAELFRMTSGVFYDEAVRTYPGSWLLVHTLLLGEAEHQRAFEGYLGALRTGALDEQRALVKYFDGQTIAGIKQAYTARATMHQLPEVTVPLVARAKSDVVVRRLSASEAFVLWGELRPPVPEGQILAERDARQAIEKDPRAPAGYVLRAALRFRAEDTDAALKDLRYAVELAPKDPRVLRALGIVLFKRKEAPSELAAVTTRLRNVAASADDFLFLARAELAAKRPEPALDLALRAARLQQGCFVCLETAAGAAARLGDAARAVKLQQTAVNYASEHHRGLSRMLERLDRYRRLLREQQTLARP